MGLIKKRQTDLDLAQTPIIFGKQVGLERRFAVFSGRLLDDSAAATPLVKKPDDGRSRFVIQPGEGNLYQTLCAHVLHAQRLAYPVKETPFALGHHFFVKRFAQLHQHLALMLVQVGWS